MPQSRQPFYLLFSPVKSFYFVIGGCSSAATIKQRVHNDTKAVQIQTWHYLMHLEFLTLVSQYTAFFYCAVLLGINNMLNIESVTTVEQLQVS